MRWLLPLSTFLFIIFISFIQLSNTTPYHLDYPKNFGNRIIIPTNNATTTQGVTLGRFLFYETKLSANNQLSCGSCHEQKRAFTDGRPVSIGINGQKTSRNAMSLANLLWVRQLFWDGRANSLEEQALFPITHPQEMGQNIESVVESLQNTSNYPLLFKEAFGSPTITPDRIAKALAQFERTLISSNSRYDRYLAGTYIPTSLEKQGMALFEGNTSVTALQRGGNCAHCHGGPKLYKELFHDNGLDIVPKDSGRYTLTKVVTDIGRFRVPTLRNILLTAPYMHDGRFSTIEEVIDHYSDHIQPSPNLSNFIEYKNDNQQRLSFTKDEKKALLAFLEMLTDSSFITNPAFSNPHDQKP